MTPFARRAIILAVLMLCASVLSIALTPAQRIIAEAERPDLETLIPRQFDDWYMDERSSHTVINPQTQTSLNAIYSQVLSRTYINHDGRRIMLSLAYGEDQSGESRIHRPEVCYPSQGFQIARKWKDSVSADSIAIPVMRITTRLGNRYEPVTYWIRVGNSIARGGIEQTFIRAGQGLAGNIPDGILFRVSEINQDAEDSFAIQDQFIRSLLSSIPPSDQKILIGSLGLK